MKLRVLDLGTIMGDQAWSLMDTGAASESNPSPPSVRRSLKVIATLIAHSKAGVILYEPARRRPSASYGRLRCRTSST